MHQNPKAAHIPGKPNRRGQRKPQQRTRYAALLIPPITRKLANQQSRQRIGLIALRRLGQKPRVICAVKQGHTSSNRAGADGAHHSCAIKQGLLF
jgi:hypothetical protein